jgi:hypothetical protein
MVLEVMASQVFSFRRFVDLMNRQLLGFLGEWLVRPSTGTPITVLAAVTLREVLRGLEFSIYTVKCVYIYTGVKGKVDPCTGTEALYRPYGTRRG